MKKPPSELERAKAELDRAMEKMSKPYWIVKDADIKLTGLKGWVPNQTIEKVGNGDYVVTLVERFHIPADRAGARLVLVLKAK